MDIEGVLDRTRHRVVRSEKENEELLALRDQLKKDIAEEARRVLRVLRANHRSRP